MEELFDSSCPWFAMDLGSPISFSTIRLTTQNSIPPLKWLPQNVKIFVGNDPITVGNFNQDPRYTEIYSLPNDLIIDQTYEIPVSVTDQQYISFKKEFDGTADSKYLIVCYLEIF